MAVGPHVVVVYPVVFYFRGQCNVFVAVAIGWIDHKVVHPLPFLHFYPHIESGVVEHSCEYACGMVVGVEPEVAWIFRRITIAVGGAGENEERGERSEE